MMSQGVISEAHFELLDGPSRAGLALALQSGNADRERGAPMSDIPADGEWSSSMVNSR
jgi:hypothetical protein